MQMIYQMWAAAIPEMDSVTDFSTTLVYQPVPASAAQVALSNGIGNTWGLPAKAYNFWEIQTAWSDPAHDYLVEGWYQATLESIHAALGKAGVAIPLVYYNDAADYQDAFATLPAASLAKMRSIRSKYDPSLVFTKLCAGGYKLDHPPNLNA
jgi:hypothetical protein